MKKIKTFLIALSTPVIISMMVVNLFISHQFLKIEYQMPWFPPDTFGFSLEDRLAWGGMTIDYLRFGDEYQSLSDIKMLDGTAIYNEREISHMVDVKNVIDLMNQTMLKTLVLFIAILFLAYKQKDFSAVYKGVYYASMFTLIAILSIGGFASISFWKFFEWFHSIFFQGDTWLFLVSDSLIRLFPIVFWQDAVMYILAIIILINLVLFFVMKRKSS
jgi:integral membrane protein (TIGR01906 family)